MEKVVIILLVCLCISSCKKGGKSVETLSKTEIGKKTTNKVVKEVTYMFNNLKLSKGSSKYLKEFSEKNIQNLTSDLKRLEGKSFEKYVKKHPESLEAYGMLGNSMNLRTNVGFLSSISKQLKEAPNKLPTIRVGTLQHRQGDAIVKHIKEVNSKYKDFGVTFSRQILEKGTYKIEGMFPDFTKHRLIDIIMPIDYFEKSNKVQFSYCMNNLRKEYAKNPKELIEKLKLLNKGQTYLEVRNGKTVKLEGNDLLKRQLIDLENKHGNKLFGFTWHHHQDSGKMELISENIHNKVSHVGGNLIWGSLR